MPFQDYQRNDLYQIKVTLNDYQVIEFDTIAISLDHLQALQQDFHSHLSLLQYIQANQPTSTNYHQHEKQTYHQGK